MRFARVFIARRGASKTPASITRGLICSTGASTRPHVPQVVDEYAEQEVELADNPNEGGREGGRNEGGGQAWDKDEERKERRHRFDDDAGRIHSESNVPRPGCDPSAGNDAIYMRNRDEASRA